MSREDVRVVGVEVLVDVEDEVGDAAVGVGDLRKSVGRAVRDDSLDRSSVISGEARCSVRLHCGRLSVCHRSLQGAQDVPRLADSSHRGLNTLSPEIDVGDVVRLAHTMRGRPVFTSVRRATGAYTPNMILLLLAYLDATLDQSSANCSFVGPPCPMIYQYVFSATRTQRQIRHTSGLPWCSSAHSCEYR